jgi:prepilin-type processing-associated H-X9-DG protein/prepilin-type N-terminal cleavage/methylation domain-containing protein
MRKPTKTRRGCFARKEPVARPAAPERRNAIGFTIVELLVTIAILSILASLLLPSLKCARENAKAIVCMNNLRQIYMAYSYYAQDHDDWFAPDARFCYTLGYNGYCGAGEMHGGHTTTWHSEKRFPIFRCPAEKGWVFTYSDSYCIQPPPLTTYYDHDLAHSSYAVNWHMNHASYAQGSPGFATRPVLKPGGRAATPFIVDCATPQWGWGCQIFRDLLDRPDMTYEWPYQGATFYMFRHPGNRINILYLDGHVAAAQHFNVTGKKLEMGGYEGDPFTDD